MVVEDEGEGHHFSATFLGGPKGVASVERVVHRMFLMMCILLLSMVPRALHLISLFLPAGPARKGKEGKSDDGTCVYHNHSEPPHALHVYVYAVRGDRDIPHHSSTLLQHQT